ncbi:MAG: hypothetical protein ABIP85_20065 [Chthoniobacteraceae bacterium]
MLAAAEPNSLVLIIIFPMTTAPNHALQPTGVHELGVVRRFCTSPVRTILLLLFLFRTVALAAERPFNFGLSGAITITKATYWMDGGSVTVLLRDEQGTQASVRYEQNLFPNPHNGQFLFRVPHATKPTYFRRHGSYELSLLELLRTATVTTFGTSDPDLLKASSNWNHLAMSALFRAAASPRTSPNSK